MFEYRITKYNPANRIDGRYSVDDWTSFGDIGKSFGKAELTYKKYLETETAYIDCCIDLLSKAQILSLSVEQAECYSEDLCIPASVSDVAEIRKLIAAWPREKFCVKVLPIKQLPESRAGLRISSYLPQPRKMNVLCTLA